MLQNAELRERVLKAVLRKATSLAERESRSLVADAVANAEQALATEIDRLVALRALNPTVREAEIEALRAQQSSLREVLSKAQLRLDAIRVIQRGA